MLLTPHNSYYSKNATALKNAVTSPRMFSLLVDATLKRMLLESLCHFKATFAQKDYYFPDTVT